MSDQFRNYLKQFNRKERFYVVREATKGGFALDGVFKQKLEQALGISIPDQDVFVAMDYHLDWIYASLFLCGKTENKPYLLNPDLITASQEDVDLLIAASDPVDPMITNLIMIEAKGDTSWTNKQAESKAKRLNKIFVQGEFEHLIRPHYLIWSPSAPKNLKFDCFPNWARRDSKVPHIELKMDEGLTKVTRCDMNGKNNAEGEFWKVENVGKKITLE